MKGYFILARLLKEKKTVGKYNFVKKTDDELDKLVCELNALTYDI